MKYLTQEEIEKLLSATDECPSGKKPLLNPDGGVYSASGPVSCWAALVGY
ncbi:hypothetical protein KCP75_02595 [Salmonella enterica subsp. enterica]|nr:hypothetical protein KCP75_02595 [Salmonella enterica subsp. enterica]